MADVHAWFFGSSLSISGAMDYDEQLTKREQEILALVAQGQRNREIARQLIIAEPTVENHLHRIYQKLGVSTRTEAAMTAIRKGLIGLQN